MTNLKIANDVLSETRCAELIAAARAMGFASMAHRYPPSYRNNDRLLLDDPALAEELLDAMREHLAEERIDDEGRCWRLSALNTRFRVCRYRDGQRFSVHRDGSHAVSDTARSLTTVMLYLNEQPAFEGGRTRFYADGRGGEPTRVIVPRRGMAAVFDHALWHDGEPVPRGEKLVLRTDVVYQADRPWRKEHVDYVWCLAEGPDATIASGSRDCRIRLWRRDLTLVRELVGHTSSVGVLHVHDGVLHSASRDGELRRWHRESTVMRQTGPAILSMTSAPDGRLVCGTASGELEAWRADGSHSAKRLHDSWLWCVVSDGDALFTASEDGSLRCMSPTRSWRAFTHTPLRALAVSDTMVVAAGVDGVIRRWTPDGRPLARAGVVEAPICALALAGETIVAGDEEGVVHAFTGGRHRVLARHRDQVRSLLVLGSRVLSAAYDGAIRANSLSPDGGATSPHGQVEEEVARRSSTCAGDVGNVQLRGVG